MLQLANIDLGSFPENPSHVYIENILLRQEGTFHLIV